MVFGLGEDAGGGGDLTGLTSLDGSVVIADPGGPVPDLSVLKVYGVTSLGTGPMGNLPTGNWFQAPLPTAGALQNCAAVASSLIPDIEADYVVGWGAAAEYAADPANSVLRFVLSVNGQPGGGGTLVN